MTNKMMNNKTLEQYLRFENGKDIMDAGIHYKTSTAQLQMIVMQRLKDLRDYYSDGLTDETLGTWNDAFEPIYYQKGDEVTNTQIISSHITKGSKITFYHNGDIQKAKVLSFDQGDLELETEDALFQTGVGSDLNGKAKDGHGLSISLNQLELKSMIVNKSGVIKKGDNLNPNITIGKKNGDFVRITRNLSSDAGRSRVFYDSNNNSLYNVTIPENYTGMIRKANDNQIEIKFDETIPDTSTKVIKIDRDYLQKSGVLQVSSLGQTLPQNKEKLVMEESLSSLLEGSVLETKTAYDMAVELIAGGDPISVGPPGSGKTQTANSSIALAQKYLQVIITEESCQVNCHPLSVIQGEDAVVQACAECKDKYDPNFKKTRFFTPPKPEDVKVAVRKLEEGSGILKVQATDALKVFDLVGFRVPDLRGQYVAPGKLDFSRIKYGYFPKTNNGFLLIDEFEKMLQNSFAASLSAIGSDKVNIQDTDFSTPANNVTFATVNDSRRIPAANNDRSRIIGVDYASSEKIEHKITDVAVYGKKLVPEDSLPIHNFHEQEFVPLDKLVPLSVLLENTIDDILLKYRKERLNGDPDNIFASGRSKIDAYELARAYWIIDDIFYSATPGIPNEDYAIKGMQTAWGSRVTETNYDERDKQKQDLSGFIKDNFKTLYVGEIDRFWCGVRQDIANIAKDKPEVKDSYNQELTDYEQNPQMIKTVYEKFQTVSDDNDLEVLNLTYPLMEQLFYKQRNMGKFDSEFSIPLVQYFLDTKRSFDSIQSEETDQE